MASTEFRAHRNRLAAVFTPRAEAAERAHDGDVEGAARVLNGVTGRLFVHGEVRRAILERAAVKAPQTPAQ